MRYIVSMIVGLLMSGVAVASPWSVHLMVGVGDALGAQSHGAAAVAQVGQACGCSVSSSIATNEPAAQLSARYNVRRWLAVEGSAFNLATFYSAGTANVSATQSYAFTVNDRVYGGTVQAVVRGRFARVLWHIGAGVAVSHDSETSWINGGGAASSASASTTKASAAVSGGIGYRFADRWSVGASVLYVPHVGSTETATGGEYTNGGLLLAGADLGYRF